jgi:hypothetical protein
MNDDVEEAADERPEESGCGYLGAHWPETLTGGPEGSPVSGRSRRPGYQLPVLEQPPLSFLSHVRFTASPELVLVIVKWLPEADWPMMV